LITYPKVESPRPPPLRESKDIHPRPDEVASRRQDNMADGEAAVQSHVLGQGDVEDGHEAARSEGDEDLRPEGGGPGPVQGAVEDRPEGRDGAEEGEGYVSRREVRAVAGEAEVRGRDAGCRDVCRDAQVVELEGAVGYRGGVVVDEVVCGLCSRGLR